MADQLDCGRCGESLRDQRYAENAAKGIAGVMWTDREEVECSNCHALNVIEFVDDSEDADLVVVETIAPVVH